MRSSQQHDRNRLQPRSRRVHKQSENDLDVLELHLACDAVCVRKVWPNICLKLANPLRREVKALQLFDVAGVSLHLGIEVSDAPLGSSHPRCELILVNQAVGEAVDEALQRVLFV